MCTDLSAFDLYSRRRSRFSHTDPLHARFIIAYFYHYHYHYQYRYRYRYRCRCRCRYRYCYCHYYYCTEIS